MSGDQLRNCAILGDEKQLRHLLKGGANPCSTDADGLTALHYAVWNKHEQCIKVLVANHEGTNDDGEHVSSLSVQSDIGLTPLHLTVLENSDRYVLVTFIICVIGRVFATLHTLTQLHARSQRHDDAIFDPRGLLDEN